jgi:hypothetical protein
MTSLLRNISGNGNAAVMRRVLTWIHAGKTPSFATIPAALNTPVGYRGDALMKSVSTPFRSFSLSTFGVLAIVLMVFATFVIGISTARAQEPGAGVGPLEAVFGTVVEIGENTLTIATDDAITVINVDDNTILRVDEDTVDLDAIAIGDALAATVSVLDNGSLLAHKILVRPDNNAARSFIHVVGVVTGVEDGTFTLTDVDGGTVTLDLPAGVAPPEIGDALTTVAKRDRVTDRLAAHALEKVEAIIDRLEAALERAEEAVARAGNETSQARLIDLKQRIEDNASRHLGLIDQVKTTAVDAVTSALDRKFDEAQRRYEGVADRTGVKRPVVEVKGVVREVTDGEIVIGLPNGGEIRISLDSDVATEDLDGDDTDVSQFVTGTDVVIKYRRTTGEGRAASSVKELEPKLSRQEEARINAESEREFSGIITSVQRPSADELVDAIAIVIIANENVGRKIVVRVTRTTEIKVNDQGAGVDGLSPGMFAKVELLSGLVASEIKAHDVRAEEQEIRGVVRKVDPLSGVIAIITGDRERGLIELHVDDFTLIEKDGVHASLVDVVPGDLVRDESRFRIRDRVMTRLVLRSQTEFRISGVIAGVDRAESSVTVITDDGSTIRFNVSANTRIQGQHGEDFRLSEIMPGFRLVEARIETVTINGLTRHVATRMVVGVPELTTARGEVIRVVPASGNITIRTTNGHELALSLPDNGRFTIVKDGEQRDSLRGIESGDLVHSVTFQPLNNTIVKMEIVTQGGTAVRGTIVGVGAEGNRIKIETASGDSLELVANGDSDLRMNGEQIRSLGRLSEGDEVVYALFVRRSVGNVILRLEAISGRQISNTDVRPERDDRPSVEFRIKGVIVVIEGDTWLVGDTKFLVNRGTEFHGDTPVAGAVAAVVLVQEAREAPIAVRVGVDAPERREITPRAQQEPARETRRLTVTGLIEKIDGERWMVGGVEFTINRQTEIVGEPEIGARAGVVVFKLSDGGLVALQISVERTILRFSTTDEAKPTPDTDNPVGPDTPVDANKLNTSDRTDEPTTSDKPDDNRTGTVLFESYGSDSSTNDSTDTTKSGSVITDSVS